MQAGAWTFAEMIKAQNLRPDLIACSALLNAAELLGLIRRQLPQTPLLLYFHENQYSYPERQGQSYHWGVINSASALAADRLLFNSEFHKRDFFKHWRRGDRVMPDGRLGEALLAAKENAARVIPVGLDFDALDREEVLKSPGPPLLLWNHRWEHDKQPELLFKALRGIKARGIPFRLAVCGEQFQNRPTCFAQAEKEFRDEIDSFGYLSRTEYAQLLWRADVVISTALQEFLGLSVLEAMWCGCYPLLPKRLSYPFLLPEDQQGLLYSKDEALESRLLRLLKRPSLYPARQAFLHRYAWPQVAQDLDEQVKSLLDAKGVY